MTFKNRREAGRLLAERLLIELQAQPGPDAPEYLVVALPRGGVPVALEVARALKAPLETLMVRKIGAPGNPEYGIGAVVEGGFHWIDERRAREAGAPPSDLSRSIESELAEAQRRVQLYRPNSAVRSIEARIREKNVILVDDGLATGVSARVACRFLKQMGAARVILATPVCVPETARALRSEADSVVCLREPSGFGSVGQFYEDFSQLTDDEVLADLAEARNIESRSALDTEIEIPLHIPDADDSPGCLSGRLLLPASSCQGLVIFAHGSGSSRRSPRNLEVALTLRAQGLGCLLFDLLTETESRDRRLVFDIPLLASRLKQVHAWVRTQASLKSLPQDLPIGFFGASTGAGAALWAAADLGEDVAAVVSRGGRPDLAASRLSQVQAPVLLIVGGADAEVLRLNELALRDLGQGALKVVTGATHLFEEPGTLSQVSELAGQWFAHWFRGAANSSPLAYSA